MGRTRLRGIEVGGVLAAIEVPQSYDWEWGAHRDELPITSPAGAEVHVGVRIGVIEPPQSEGVVYSTAHGTFEVGRRGDDWWIATFDGGQCERVGHFSSDFSIGEIVVSREFARRCRYPLEHPLDELVTLHRALRTGGLLVRGQAAVRDSRALLVLGTKPSDAIAGVSDAHPKIQCSLAERDLVILREREGDVQVVGELQSRGHGRPPMPVAVPLDAIHVVRRTNQMSADRLQVDEALSCLLEASVAPVHAGEDADRLMELASAISWRVPMLELCVPQVADVVPFRWGERQAGLGFSATPTF